MRTFSAYNRSRKGVVLLVVLAMLTLFSVVAVTFVYFSENQASSAGNFKDSQTVTTLDSEQLSSFLLRQVVYDTSDPLSALRMQGLLTNMYGLQGNTPFSGTGGFHSTVLGTTVNPSNIGTFDLYTLRNLRGQNLGGEDPFTNLGTARAYEQKYGSPNAPYTYPDHNAAFLATLGGNGSMSFRSYMRSVRFTLPMIHPVLGPTIAEVEFNPYEFKHREFWSWYSYTTPMTYPVTNKIPNGLIDTANPYYYGDDGFHYDLDITVAAAFAPTTANPIPNWYTVAQLLADGYTFPATPAIRIVSGEVFFRFIPADRDILRAMVFRPGPWDNIKVLQNVSPTVVRVETSFPAPSDTGGDVKNLMPGTAAYIGLIGGSGQTSTGADSIWMDIGHPIFTAKNGRKVKPLAAITIIDQESKLNVNANGNIQAIDFTNTDNEHASGITSYPWNVSFQRLLLNAGLSPAQARADNMQLHNGVNISNFGRVDGKYGGLANTNLYYAQAPQDSAATSPNAYSPITPSGKEYSPPFDLSGTFDQTNLAGNPDAVVVVNEQYTISSAYVLPGTFATWNTANFPNPPNLNPNVADRSLSMDRFPRRVPFGTTAWANAATIYPPTSRGANESAAVEMYHFANTNVRSPLFHSPINSNFSNTAGRNRVFGPWNIEALYRYGDLGSEKIDSELRKVIPTSFAQSRVRFNLTTNSTDLNRIGASPWWNASATSSLTMPPPSAANPNRIPSSAGNVSLGTPPSVTYNGVPATGQTPNTVGDYELDPNTSSIPLFPLPALPRTIQGRLRSTLAQLDRVDLNAQLPDYPVPDTSGMAPPIDTANVFTLNAYTAALQARQTLASALFHRLLMSSGVDTLTIDTNPEVLDAVRWMAQLAVNIVDYIDGDSYITYFNWVPSVQAYNAIQYPLSPAPIPPVLFDPAGKFVYGTEIPRLLVNESYVQAVNDSGANARFQHWVELYNPMPTLPVRLRQDYTPGAGLPQRINSYRLVVTTDAGTSNFGDRDNTRGVPSTIDMTNDTPTGASTRVINLGDAANRTVSGSTDTLAAINAALPNPPGYNFGFYLVGPSATFPTTGGPASTRATPNQTDAGMDISTPIGLGGSQPDLTTHKRAILLQKLLCDHLRHQPDPTAPLYNPYITIDAMTDLVGMDAIELLNPPAPNPGLVPVVNRHSWAKPQPYVSNQQLHINSRTTTPSTTEAQHTFFGQNVVEDITFGAGVFSVNGNNDWLPGPPGTEGLTNQFPNPNAANQTALMPYSWLVHLDRQAISPGELLHVSGYKPHQLTHRFYQTPMSFVVQLAAGFTAGTAINVTTAGNVTPNVNLNRTLQDGLPYIIRDGSPVLVARGNNRFWTTVTTVAGNLYTFPVDLQQNDRVSFPHYFAQYAPWMNESTRIFRFLETIATRNPGADMSQFIFTPTRGEVNSAPPAGYTTNGAVPLGRYRLYFETAGSRLSNLFPQVTVNDAIINLAKDDVVTGTANMLVLDVNKAASYIEVASPVVPSSTGALAIHYHSGRQPGRIQLNTTTDDAVMESLVDHQRSNGFSTAQAASILNRRPTSMVGRNRPFAPGVGMNSPSSGLYGSTADVPFKSLATGPSPASALTLHASGLNDTLLRTDPSDNFKLLFESGDPNSIPVNSFASLANSFSPYHHPYLRYQLLTKIWNNVTTRSNVFAIWMTIGFFEVDEATGRLGAEIDQLEGNAKRHRFFAVVDRTALDRYIRMNQIQLSNGSFVSPYDVRRGIPAVNQIDQAYQNKPAVALPGFLANPGADARFDTPVHPMRTATISAINVAGNPLICEVQLPTSVALPGGDTTGIAPGLPVILNANSGAPELCQVMSGEALGVIAPTPPTAFWGTGAGRFFMLTQTPQTAGTVVTISLPAIPRVVIHSAVLQ